MNITPFFKYLLVVLLVQYFLLAGTYSFADHDQVITSPYHESQGPTQETKIEGPGSFQTHPYTANDKPIEKTEIPAGELGTPANTADPTPVDYASELAMINSKKLNDSIVKIMDDNVGLSVPPFQKSIALINPIIKQNEACQKTFETAKKMCLENSSPHIQQAAAGMALLGGGLGAAGVTNKCDTLGKVMITAEVGLSGFLAFCGYNQYKCAEACEELKKSVTDLEVNLRTENSQYISNCNNIIAINPGVAESGTHICNQVVMSQIKAKVETALKFTGEQLRLENKQGIALKAKNCSFNFKLNLASAGVGLVGSVLPLISQGKGCKKETDGNGKSKTPVLDDAVAKATGAPQNSADQLLVQNPSTTSTLISDTPTTNESSRGSNSPGTAANTNSSQASGGDAPSTNTLITNSLLGTSQRKAASPPVTRELSSTSKNLQTTYGPSSQIAERIGAYTRATQEILVNDLTPMRATMNKAIRRNLGAGK